MARSVDRWARRRGRAPAPPPHARSQPAPPPPVPPPRIASPPRSRPSTARSRPAVSTRRRKLECQFAYAPVHRRAAVSLISAVTAPRLAARLPHRHLDQVNTIDLLASLAGDPSPPTSSIFTRYGNRARRRSPVDGGRRRRCQQIPLVEAKLMAPAPHAAVDGVAGAVVAGGGEFKRSRAAGADPIQ